MNTEVFNMHQLKSLIALLGVNDEDAEFLCDYFGEHLLSKPLEIERIKILAKILDAGYVLSHPDCKFHSLLDVNKPVSQLALAVKFCDTPVFKVLVDTVLPEDKANTIIRITSAHMRDNKPIGALLWLFNPYLSCEAMDELYKLIIFYKGLDMYLVIEGILYGREENEKAERIDLLIEYLDKIHNLIFDSDIAMYFNSYNCYCNDYVRVALKLLSEGHKEVVSAFYHKPHILLEVSFWIELDYYDYNHIYKSVSNYMRLLYRKSDDLTVIAGVEQVMRAYRIFRYRCGLVRKEVPPGLYKQYNPDVILTLLDAYLNGLVDQSSFYQKFSIKELDDRIVNNDKVSDKGTALGMDIKKFNFDFSDFGFFDFDDVETAHFKSTLNTLSLIQNYPEPDMYDYVKVIRRSIFDYTSNKIEDGLYSGEVILKEEDFICKTITLKIFPDKDNPKLPCVEVYII